MLIAVVALKTTPGAVVARQHQRIEILVGVRVGDADAAVDAVVRVEERAHDDGVGILGRQQRVVAAGAAAERVRAPLKLVMLFDRRCR